MSYSPPAMHPVHAVGAVLLILVVLWDAFETVVLPHRVSRRFRLTRLFYRATWLPWRVIGMRRKPGNPRENLLSVYGPMSLLLLLGTWAASLMFAFGLLHWALGTRLQGTATTMRDFSSDLYYSGTTFLTLGLGDLVPASGLERILTVIEAGTGFAFLALVIGYLPVLSQAFSRREASITLLDARAGSPPSAYELLRRHSSDHGLATLDVLLADWERWSANLLETHVSFPVLAYYRSQHDNQSWVAALTTILDVCALIIAGLEKAPVRAARLTFAMARHAVVDMSNVFHQKPRPLAQDRLSGEDLGRLRSDLAAAGLSLPEGKHIDDKLAHLRKMYEPYVNALGTFLLMPLPAWLPSENARDNWQTTAYER